MKTNYRDVIRNRAHLKYCAGMRQGSADAESGQPPRYEALWDSDTNLLTGYADGYEGMRIAIRNTAKRAARGDR